MYKIEKWSLSDLILLYGKKKINLNPPYQRNSIWSSQAQSLLADTIKKRMPIPAFFLQEKGKGLYDMVDGQQRTRAIIKYTKKVKTIDSLDYDFSKKELDDYKISVHLLPEKLPVEEVREFYVRVNRAGKRLERPELNKAEFFDTKFLKLVNELTSSEGFQNLALFKKADVKRMFDRDFVEELVAQLSHGITDKKKTVDAIYKEDINDSQFESLKSNFLEIIQTISELDELTPLSKTRFSQKNDFYTLFGLVQRLKGIETKAFKEIYMMLVSISVGIRPSNEKCSILQEYAFNCVTQSNSKKARERRLRILGILVENRTKTPNKYQSQVLKYFNAIESPLLNIKPFYIIDHNVINEIL